MTETDMQPRVSRVVVFRLGEQRYAFPVQQVQEIQQIVRPTQVPDTWPALLGMIDLRGAVLPLIDLRTLLGLAPGQYDLQTPMVIGRVNSVLIAFIVDEVEDVIDVPPDCVQAPSTIYELADKMIGVCRLGEGLIFILDASALLPEEQTIAVTRLVEEGA